MQRKIEKFIKTLEELFETDKSDLDFGVYRIINQKRDQINNFLYNTLPQEIDDYLNKLYKTKEEKYDAEDRIYSHLINFFSRYYDNGDFISKRRYKEGVYAIPYEGEEVKLYWANQDQYYIKSSENFKDYIFKIGNKKKVHFKLIEADTEINNNKSISENKLFSLVQDEFIEINNDELVIKFEYKGFPKTVKQDKLNKDSLDCIMKFLDSNIRDERYIDYCIELRKEYPTEKNKKRTLLEKELYNYTSKNSFDYFIHKDLGGFLRRELDFYIKNEVLFIDDIGTEREKDVLNTLDNIKIIKQIANKIIKFLEQIENFQKKLWLKKKFVVDCNYCITLDRIPNKFYQEIISNEQQINEWKNLFNIETTSVDEKFLEENKFLVLDTKFFDEDFKETLLSTFDNLDNQTNGLLIHSDNFQALNLLENKYENSIDVIYIDPPYNTVHSEILYKNQFKHSSWLSMISNNLSSIDRFFSNEFCFGLAIDDYEFTRVSMLLDNIFKNYDKSTVVVNHHPQGSGGRLSRTHEYLILISKYSSPAYLGKPVDDYEEDRMFMRSGTAINNFREGRWKSFYALLVDENNIIIDAEEPIPLGEDYPLEKTIEGYKRIYPINSKGEERVWRSSYETGKIRINNQEIFISDKGAIYQKISHEKKRELLFSNWIDAKFNAGTQGSNVLKDIGLGNKFNYPKSIKTVETSIWAQSYGKSDVTVLDFFGGSGTTAHATINLNREDNGNRKYILVEMGEYFNTVTKPRIQKVIYASEWKDGKPNSKDGISHMFKYMTLEQYEDTLNNIVFDDIIKLDDEKLQEEYLISYMLDMESKNSNTFLNIDDLKNPFDYKLNIERNTEIKHTKIDLVETFNYLLGLNVEKISAKEYYNYDGENIESYPEGSYIFKRIEGSLKTKERILIIWRNLTNNIKEDNDVLNKYLSKKRITLDEYDYIYVNGDNTIQINNFNNHKIKLIDEEFKFLMFDVDNI